MKYAIYKANGKRIPGTIFSTRWEAVEMLEALSGDPIVGREYRGAYVDSYVSRSGKSEYGIKGKLRPFGL